MSAYKQRWYRREQCQRHHLPERVRSWLFDPSSLTARLQRRSPHQFRVELLSQQMETAALDENRVLGVRSGRGTLVRQVRLYCADTAVVYARTVIPVSTLTGVQRSYANLGNRPLGAMLFADKTMRRDPLMVSVLQPNNPLYQKTGVERGDIWGRRSVFYVGGKPLLVSEYFLPSLFTE